MKKIYRTIITWLILIILSSGFTYYYTNRYVSSQFTELLAIYNYLENSTHCWWSTFKVTQYTNHASECSKEKDHVNFGVTASGLKAIKNRTVAVDPKVVPLGSKLIDVETGEIYDADDTGNKVKGYHVDMYIGEGTDENRKKAAVWGCKRKLFIVIEAKKIRNKNKK